MERSLLPEPHRILSILKHTDMEHTFRVSCAQEPMPGQFFMLSLPRVGEAPISASGKGPGYVEFTIRNVGYLTNVLFDLVPGNTIFLRGPYGNGFPVRQFENKDLVIICGGTGMAPVLTLMQHFYDHPEVCKTVHIIAGFHDEKVILFRRELERFKKRFHMIVTLYRDEKEGFETGKLSNHVDKIPWETFTDYNVVVVAGGFMMQSSVDACLAQGVPIDKIWVSYERKMSCGLGKCGHCRINETYVCLDGPVFNYAYAKDKLMD